MRILCCVCVCGGGLQNSLWDSDLNNITVVDVANVNVCIIWKFDVHHTIWCGRWRHFNDWTLRCRITVVGIAVICGGRKPKNFESDSFVHRRREAELKHVDRNKGKLPRLAKNSVGKVDVMTTRFKSFFLRWIRHLIDRVVHNWSYRVFIPIKMTGGMDNTGRWYTSVENTTCGRCCGIGDGIGTNALFCADFAIGNCWGDHIRM